MGIFSSTAGTLGWHHRCFRKIDEGKQTSKGADPGVANGDTVKREPVVQGRSLLSHSAMFRL